jgi:hypothetical protein
VYQVPLITGNQPETGNREKLNLLIKLLRRVLTFLFVSFWFFQGIVLNMFGLGIISNPTAFVVAMFCWALPIIAVLIGGVVKWKVISDKPKFFSDKLYFVNIVMVAYIATSVIISATSSNAVLIWYGRTRVANYDYSTSSDPVRRRDNRRVFIISTIFQDAVIVLLAYVNKFSWVNFCDVACFFLTGLFTVVLIIVTATAAEDVRTYGRYMLVGSVICGAIIGIPILLLNNLEVGALDASEIRRKQGTRRFNWGL